ncbi:MAG: plasma-membrane proton-efflux P-type ATPase [Candidatus Aminicenantes bacterium]|nr:plasma-membrane proton-efflux P-type ATPase [Candidatus Aminicenantes bacterium]
MNEDDLPPQKPEPEVGERKTMADLIASLGTDLRSGLTSASAADRLMRFGPNEVPEKKTHPFLLVAKKFWGLTAWMLELIIVLSFILRKYPDAGIVAALLVMNAVISVLEEKKAAGAVEALKKELSVNARTLRDGAWTIIHARELVPGDVVRLRAGDIVPADVEVAAGALAVDQSALTGESLAVEKGAEDLLYSGSVIKRGEATGVVLRTGAGTKFGRTVELIQVARPKLHMEEVVTKLVRWLLLIVGALLALTTAVSVARDMALLEILPLMLVLLLSAIPVALPVMYTVSMAVGARELAKRSVLVTRLSATEDAATMDVLCVDKTGTLTLNELSISQVIPVGPFTEREAVLFGAMASQEANRDPLDLAFIRQARERGWLDPGDVQESFTPFDPATRKTEAVVRRGDHRFHIMKGAVSVIAGACGLGPEDEQTLELRVGDLSKRGYRTVAVAVAEGGKPAVVGLVALSDSPRPDSKQLIEELHALGVSVKMLTGDALPIAMEIAGALGIGKDISRVSDLKDLLKTDPTTALRQMEKSDGFAEVYPEDKYMIVRSLQAAHHVVGMTGDGVNDAPALKQAEVGIAVNNATDVAKSAASVVLTSEGLSGIVELVKNGRKVYQRINTWILNKIMRTILKSTFVVGVFLVTGDFVISAFAMVLLLLMTDFMKISLSTDRVQWSPSPDTWNIKAYVRVAAALGTLMVLESFAALALGQAFWRLRTSDPVIRTFSFEILLFSAVTSIFVIRERRRFWSSRPSRLLLTIMALNVIAGGLISTFGIPGLFPALPVAMTLFLFGWNLALSLILNDYVKLLLLKRMKLGGQAHHKNCTN